MRIITRSLPAFCIALFATCFLLFSASCSRDKCSSVTCANGGVCNNGNCTCAVGYQGASCQTISRAAWLGNWAFFEKGSAVESQQYPMSIQAGNPNINNITFTNFLNYFSVPVSGYVVNNNLFIPSQQVQGSSVQGAGYITQTAAGNTITISCTVTNLTTNVSTTYNTYTVQ